MAVAHSTMVGISAHVLTPFYYHGLYAKDGSATHPNVITDTAMIFALRQTIFGSPAILRNKPDYKADLLTIPWRASLLLSETNQIMPPVRHTIDVAREGGYHENMQKNMGSGNFKGTFFVHEVAVNSHYSGVLFGPNPFAILNAKRFVVRVGVAKLGMLEISQNEEIKETRLNTATAKLFGRNDLKEEYRILDTIRVSESLPLEKVSEELQQWY